MGSSSSSLQKKKTSKLLRQCKYATNWGECSLILHQCHNILEAAAVRTVFRSRDTIAHDHSHECGEKTKPIIPTYIRLKGIIVYLLTVLRYFEVPL